MQRTTRHAVHAISLVLLALLIWGCEDAPQKKKTASPPLVGVMLYRKDDPYIRIVTETIQNALAGKVRVEAVYAEGDQLLQEEQLSALIAKADAIALNIVDPLAAGKAVDTIKRAGIPVVFFNREPDAATIKRYDKARFVGTTAHDAGTLQGDLIREIWEKHPEYDRNGDGKFQYIMLQANLDNPEAVARTEYSVTSARKGGVPMQQIGGTFLCEWDAHAAREAVGAALPQLEGEVEIIIANNDAMALGAIAALQEKGYNREGNTPEKFIPVIGVDAIPQAMEAIRNGTMSATVVQDGKAMGDAVAAMILNLLAGRDPLADLPYPWDESGIAIRIPYSRYSAGK